MGPGQRPAEYWSLTWIHGAVPAQGGTSASLSWYCTYLVIGSRLVDPRTVSVATRNGASAGAGMIDPRRSELASFLRSRRERITPEDVGLPTYGRRRTPGLRREEVAQLAGV